MIYIHIPFCRSFCTYCDFYSEIACRARDGHIIDKFVEELCVEIEERRSEIEACSTPDTLYIGGGTPSVLPLTALQKIIDKISTNHSYAEFTLEVNPDDILEQGLGYVEGLRALGVNRVSMGVQSFDDGMLRWMNRRHTAASAVQAFELLRRGGMDNISVDLIFGVSHLTDNQLLASIERLAHLRPEHISAYQLSIEQGSALAGMVERGEYVESSQEQCAEQYSLICKELSKMGYGHYEISNWALPGFEAQHNSAYWTRNAYVGLGPGAHSFDGKGLRSWNAESLSNWRKYRAAEDRCGTPNIGWDGKSKDNYCSECPGGGKEEQYCELLSEEEMREESIMLGLRTAGGIRASLCDSATVERLISAGSLQTIDNQHIRIAEDRFFVSDEIIAELL